MNLSDNFNLQDFTDWIENFLPDFTKDVRNVDIPKGLSNIKSINSIGEASLGVRVFVIETEKDPSGRKTGLAKESFSLIKNYGTPNALIAYYSSESASWRLSLLTSTPIWSEGKIITKLSNPKRQSYMLGPEAKVNTPNKFLIKQNTVSDLTDLQRRFSLEVVNKEFYKEIAERFTMLVGGTRNEGRNKKTYEEQLKLPSVNDYSQVSIEFAVRLIGRVIFAWFLREKISINKIPLMPKELLSIEAVNNHEDYYHKILEPIFFEILNRPIKSRNEAYSIEPYSFIPYLNGGLFSPHDDDSFSYNTNKQAINHNLVKVPDGWIVDFFEVLERYNFTIDENTTFDEELSIDPEMLGRIFENLLAEINPETGESARKSTGSYYTPRIIVDYMVDESLFLYLKQKTDINDDKLKAILSYDLTDDLQYPLNEIEKGQVITALEVVKILDPACGSGAFPIGALQKIVFILQQIDPHGKLWFDKQIKNTSPEIKRVLEREFEYKNFDYIRKTGIIRKNIYGIDIQPIATEISRLRCFLTLIVDQYVNDKEDNRGIQPLPNLDFKFVTANSLIGLPKNDKPGQIDMFDNQEKIDELKMVRDQYFTASGIEREQLKTEFSKLQKDMIFQLVQEHGLMSIFKAELTKKLTEWDPFSHKASTWFDPEWMFGIKDGFDVVIANPPYVRHRDLKIDFKNYLIEHYSTGNRTSDLYCYFFEEAYVLSKDNGITCFITSNKWLKAKYGQKIRHLFKEKTSLKILIDLGSNQFEAATVDTSIVIYIKIENRDNIVQYSFSIPQAQDKNNYILQGKLDTNAFNLAKQEDYTLKIKLEKIGIPLSEWRSIKINYGVLTGKNEININGEHEGVFIIDKEKSDELIDENENSQTLLKPILKGKDIGRYNVKWDQKYLICIYYGFHNEIHKYPAIQNHLNKYKEILSNRAQVKRGDHHWIELDQNPSQNYIKEFSEEKIIFPIISKGPKFHFDIEGFFHNDKAFHITGTSLKYLTAVLNSKLAYWMIKLYGPTLGNNGFEFRKIFVEQLCIPQIGSHEQKPFIEIVDKILAITKDNNYLQNATKQSQVKEYEKQIDQMVYNLYDLIPEEIAIVDGGHNGST